MKSIKKQKLFRLFLLLNNKRKKQIYFLILLLILNGIFESLSTSTIIPFLTLIVSDRKLIELNNLNKFIPLNFNTSSQLFLVITIMFCIFIIFSTFLRIFNNWYILRLSAKIDSDLSSYIFSNNIYQPYVEYTKKNSSKTISLIIEKVAACSSALNSFFMILLGSIIGSFIIIALLIYNWKIVSLSFLLLYTYYFFISKNVKKILFKNGKILAFTDPLRIRVIQEAFAGFRDIVINSTEKVYLKLFNEYNNLIKLKLAQSQVFVSSPKYLIEGLTLLTIAIIGYFFSISTLKQTEYIPLLGAFVYALQRLLPLAQQTYAAWAGYKVKSASIDEVLRELESNKYNSKSFTLKDNLSFKNHIDFCSVAYSYDSSKMVLNDLNIRINRGDHIGIYGKTGSGKSTFLDLLMGLLPPQKGKILIDNIDICEKKIQHYWTLKISHVPQIIFLKEGTIAENIAFGELSENINYDLLKRSAKSAQIYQYIKETKYGFQTVVGERGIKLSGGQRQRIALARALYKAGEVLVLDEATSALDENTEKNIIESIVRNYADLTIIMVSHRMESLKNCNRIFQVKSKGIIEGK